PTTASGPRRTAGGRAGWGSSRMSVEWTFGAIRESTGGGRQLCRGDATGLQRRDRGRVSRPPLGSGRLPHDLSQGNDILIEGVLPTISEGVPGTWPFTGVPLRDLDVPRIFEGSDVLGQQGVAHL